MFPVPKPAVPDYAPTAEGSLRSVATAPAFAVGERVRAKALSVSGHTRLPGYVRGHTGTVEIVQPAFVLPDTNAHQGARLLGGAGHNVVVCTLGSCYPWPVLGLPPSWYKDPAYRARVVKEPRAVLSEMGLELDDDVRITVHDSTSEVRWRRRHGRRPVRDGRVHLAADEVSARAHALARRSPGHDHRDGHSNVHEA